MDRYDAKTIEQKWQRVWEDARAFYTPNPPAGRGAREPLVPARDAPVPVGDAAHGARPQLHDGRRPHALPPPAGLDGHAPDGLGLVRPARRERRDPRGRPPEGDRRAEHQGDPRPDEADRLGDRLGSRDLGASPGLLPVDAVAVPALLRARARLPQGGAGELVPERPDRGRQRVRDRRALRALRRAGRGAQPRAVVHEDHRLRGRAAPLRRRRLARAHDDDPAQLDRPQRGRRDHLPRRGARPRHRGLHDAAGHAVRRDLLRASRRSIRSSRSSAATRSRSTRATPPPSAARSARPRRRRPASSPATTRPTPSTASSCRSGSPTTC